MVAKDLLPPPGLPKADLRPSIQGVTLIVPELAVEIGLNESVMLMQIRHWIMTGNNQRDGLWWTYQSVRDMRVKAFPYWSVMTINRTLQALEKQQLVVTTDRYNERKYDKTRWITLHMVGIAKLKSITLVTENGKPFPVSEWDRLYQNGTCSYQFDTRSHQNGTRKHQNDTTIPETPQRLPETPTEKKDLPAEPAPLSRSSLKTALEDAQQLTLSPFKPKLLWQFPYLFRVVKAIRRDLRRAEQAREQAAVDAAAAYYNSEASADQIVAMIDAWYQWVPCRPVTRGVIVPSERHFGNKNNRAYAANLWQRGVRPADIIRCLDNIRMAEAGSYLARFQTEPMTFQFACEKFVERWTAENREAHTYTPEAPRVTPKRPDTVINLGDLDGRDLLDVYAEHDELIVDVPPAYVSPQEAANPTPRRDVWEEWGDLPDEPATPEEIARFEAAGVL